MKMWEECKELQNEIEIHDFLQFFFCRNVTTRNKFTLEVIFC